MCVCVCVLFCVYEHVVCVYDLSMCTTYVLVYMEVKRGHWSEELLMVVSHHVDPGIWIYVLLTMELYLKDPTPKETIYKVMASSILLQ